MPRGPSDFDLAAGRFRFDLKTFLVLLALVGSWYDGRQQQREQAIQERADREKQSAIDQVQARQVTDTLAEVKRLQTAQAYDISQIKVTLAENGIRVREK